MSDVYYAKYNIFRTKHFLIWCYLKKKFTKLFIDVVLRWQYMILWILITIEQADYKVHRQTRQNETIFFVK